MRTIRVHHAGGAGILSGMAAPPASVMRSWWARATPARADAYVDHFRSSGLRRRQDGLIRITALTPWTPMAVVPELAGAGADAAVVEPAARDVLADFGARVEHFELALHAEP